MLLNIFPVLRMHIYLVMVYINFAYDFFDFQNMPLNIFLYFFSSTVLY